MKLDFLNDLAAKYKRSHNGIWLFSLENPGFLLHVSNMMQIQPEDIFAAEIQKALPNQYRNPAQKCEI